MAATKSDKTVDELAQQFDVHPNQITHWEKLLLERVGIMFEAGAHKESPPIDLKAYTSLRRVVSWVITSYV